MASLAPAKAVALKALPSPLYRLYRKQHHAHEIRRFRPRIVTHRYGGVTLTVSLQDGLAEGWYDRDWGEPAEVAMLRRHRLTRGARVFDLGAHQAVVALLLAHHVGPSGRVVAVEAESHNCEVARRNVCLNSAQNVAIVHAAVSDSPGTAWFSEGLNGCIDGSSSRLGKTPVRAVTIDELVDEHGAPDVLLIDVEGYEAKALDGATRTLCDVRPQLVIELHSPDRLARAGSTPRDVLAALDSYEVTIAEEDGDFQPLEASRELFEQRCWLFANPK